MQLDETPRLIPPSVAFRESWLAGERAYCEQDGVSTELLSAARAGFGRLVAERQGTPLWWGVPTSFFWYVSGQQYLGELVIRHELTPALADTGGHIGYSIVPPWRRQGHATAMLAAGLAQCQRFGLSPVLLTCDAANVASRRVILANGGVADGKASNGDDRFWISVGARESTGRLR